MESQPTGYSEKKKCVFVYTYTYTCIWASRVALVVKNLPANAGDIRDTGLIPGLGRAPGGGHRNHFSILAWKIPWTKELGGLKSIGSTKSWK